MEKSQIKIAIWNQLILQRQKFDKRLTVVTCTFLMMEVLVGSIFFFESNFIKIQVLFFQPCNNPNKKIDMYLLCAYWHPRSGINQIENPG